MSFITTTLQFAAVRIFFLAWVSLLLAAFPNTAAAQDIQCLQLKTMEQDLLDNLPIPVDDVTSLVGLNVNCDIREIQFVKHLSLSVDDLDAGVAERKQQQYIELHCNSEGLATLGWTSRDYIYDQDLILVMSLTATPAMCR